MTRSGGRGWYILLLIPFIAILWVPSYAGASPELAGIPFFYWYQFLWVLISAVLTAFVYFVTREPTPAESATDEPLNEELA
jgi:quinol-cytochrome oxidoreductase complex cytochrome b subunit